MMCAFLPKWQEQCSFLHMVEGQLPRVLEALGQLLSGFPPHGFPRQQPDLDPDSTQGFEQAQACQPTCHPVSAPFSCQQQHEPQDATSFTSFTKILAEGLLKN